jgi:hypothetical protein
VAGEQRGIEPDALGIDFHRFSATDCGAAPPFLTGRDIGPAVIPLARSIVFGITWRVYKQVPTAHH